MPARVNRGRVVATALAALLVGGGVLVASRPRPSPPVVVPPDLLPGGAYFVDARIGFAVAGECAAVGQPCPVWLAATVDGGVSWTLHRTPVPPFVRGAAGAHEVHAWDARRVVIENRTDPSRHRWHSTDGGATWEERGQQPDGTVDSVPARSRVTVEDTGLVVLMPDGFSARLATQPSAAVSSAVGTDLVEGTDGSLWLRGGDDERTHLVASRDRGRSWIEVVQPVGADRPALGPFVDWFDTATGRLVYLYDSQRRLWRLNDVDRRWQQIPLPDWPVENPLHGVATPDGGLVVTDPGGGRLWTVAPTSDRLAAVPAWPVRGVVRAGFGYLGTSSAGRYVSADCRTWTPLRF